MSHIFIKTSNHVLGPLSHSDLVYLAKGGSITENDFMLNTFNNSWEPINSLASIKQILTETGLVKNSKIIAIGGNKGGVGKTLFTASFAVSLSQMNKKVIAIDADFSDPDLNEWLGIKRPQYSLAHYFRKRIDHLEKLILPTQYSNLYVICGESKSLRESNPKFSQRTTFINQLAHLNSAYTILDLNPGISYSSVDLFLGADEKILITIPEPSAILSVFRFLRLALIRKLKQSLKGHIQVLDLLSQFEAPFWHQTFGALLPLVNKIKGLDTEAYTIIEAILQTFNVKIVVNMIMDPKEKNEGKYFSHAISNILLINAELLGTIPYLVDLRNYTKDKKPLKLISNSENISFQDSSLTPFVKNNRRIWPNRQKRQMPSISGSIVKSVFRGLVTNWPD